MALWRSIQALWRSIQNDQKTGTSSSPSSQAAPNTAIPDRVRKLWEKAVKLDASTEGRQRVSILTEILGSVDPECTAISLGTVYWQRAVTYRILEKRDEALADLRKAVECAERRGERNLVWDCQRVIEEIRIEKRRHGVEAAGGEKAAKFRDMEKTVYVAAKQGSEGEKAFDAIFADLENNDPEIRDEASRLMEEASSNVIQRLVETYRECLTSNPRRASLAGRVLGRGIVKRRDMEVEASEGMAYYGIPISFLSCPCVHCGHLNTGISGPPKALQTPYYHQSDPEGTYSVPVLCEKCGREFFVVWDLDPR